MGKERARGEGGEIGEIRARLKCWALAYAAAVPVVLAIAFVAWWLFGTAGGLVALAAATISFAWNGYSSVAPLVRRLRQLEEIRRIEVEQG